MARRNCPSWDDDVGGTTRFSAATYTVSEGVGSATITVRQSGSTAGDVTVDDATSDGTATDGADYTAVAGTLTFGVSETVKTFTVEIRRPWDPAPRRCCASWTTSKGGILGPMA